MKNLIPFIISAIFIFIPGSLLAETKPVYDENYSRDRAEIEDLQARYLFAADWQDADTYAETFTEDGVLDWAGGIIEGREAIRQEVHGMRSYFAKLEESAKPTRPARLRHFVTNVVIKIEGETASSRSFWFEFNNDGRERWPYLGAYGHIEEELRKVDGQWLFTKRKIFNEIMEDRAAPAHNPAW